MTIALRNDQTASTCRTVLHAFCLSTAFLAFCLFSGAVWEGNDDHAIINVLTMNNNSFCLFQWQGLTWILRQLYVYAPVVEWWAVCSFLALWLYAFACCYVMLRRHPGWSGWAISLILLLFSWRAVVYKMNFTRTAAAVSMGGALLTADSVLKEKPHHPVEFCFGWLLILFGGAIRYESAFIALGYLALTGGMWLLSHDFRLQPAWFRANAKQIVGLCLTACIFLAAFAANELLLTDEQREYAAYNSLRANIQDYHGSYLPYAEAEEAYQAAGFDAHSLDLLLNWFSEDTEIMTPEALEQVGQHRIYKIDQAQTLGILQGSHCLFVLLAVLMLAMILCGRWNWLRMAAIALFTGVSIFVFAYIGRTLARVFDSFLLCAACAAAFSGSHWTEKEENGQEKGKYRVLLHRAHRLVLAGVLVLAILTGADCVRDSWRWGAQPWTGETFAENRQEALDWIENDAEHLYFFDIRNAVYPMEDIFSFWEPRPIGYCENYIPLGGWTARHPAMTAYLEERGVANPVRALYQREDSYGTYSPRLLKHLQDHYDESIRVSEVFRINDVPIVHYTAYLADTWLEDAGYAAENLELYPVSDRETKDVWYLAAELEPTTESDPVIYCNLTVDGVRTTYRLKYENGQAFAWLYDIPEDFDPASADAVIFEHTAEDTYVQYPVQ